MLRHWLSGPLSFAALITLAAAPPAPAQLTPVGATLTEIDVSTAGTVTYLPATGREFLGTYTGGVMTLTGDGHFRLDPEDVGGLTPGYLADVDVIQVVEVGPLPVQITPRLFVDRKFVLGGGTAARPVVAIGDAAFVREGDYTAGGLRANVSNLIRSDTLTGNGFVITDTTVGPAPSYVLAATLRYSIFTTFQLSLTGTPPEVNDPTTVLTVEAGGFSNFDGYRYELNPVTVPEPAGLSLLALSAAAAMLRPGRGRRHPGQ